MDTCESCGAQADDIELVHRVYVVPESWDQDGSATTLAAVERWCFPCRASYPHESADE